MGPLSMKKSCYPRTAQQLILAPILLLIGTLSLYAEGNFTAPNEAYEESFESWLEALRVAEDAPIDEEITKLSTFQDELNAATLNASELHERRKLAACNVRDGSWVYDRKRPVYSYRCPWIRTPYNCKRNGRKQEIYERWSWKPRSCNMGKFDALSFVQRFRGKVVALIGDSFSSNMGESITCQLSRAVTIKRYIARFAGKKVRGIIAPDYNFRLITILAPYLVRYSKNPKDFAKLGLKQNNFYDYLVWTDQLDSSWSRPLKYIDFAIFMSGHWFQVSQGKTVVRSRTFVRKNRVLVNISGVDAYSLALKTVIKWVSKGSKYRGVPMFVAFSPSHYTDAAQGQPDFCKETQPSAVKTMYSFANKDWSAAWVNAEKKAVAGSKFKFLDTSIMSAGRPDGHVQTFYGRARNSKTKWDCTHWCLPGVPDAWTDMMHYVVRTQM